MSEQLFSWTAFWSGCDPIIASEWEESGWHFAVTKVKRSVTPANPNGYHYCGYARLPNKKLREDGHDGIVIYVPVHGGVTFTEKDEAGGMVYGFDCCHYGDENDPQKTDLEWVQGECRRMARALTVAEKYEDAFLDSDGDSRLDVITKYHEELAKEGIEFDLQSNTMALLRAMSGNL